MRRDIKTVIEMKLIIITTMATIFFCSCGSGNNVPKAVPGAGGAHLYELMEEDSTEQKVDTPSAP